MNASAVSHSRRALLKGRLHKSVPLRPPWSCPEERFVSLCSRCSDCVEACPEGILSKGEGGFPTIHFEKGECTFCSVCVEACATGALNRHETKPWFVKAQVYSDSCLSANKISCFSCADECAPRAIRFQLKSQGVLSPEVDLDSCNGCGACYKACPVSAIHITADGETCHA